MCKNIQSAGFAGFTQLKRELKLLQHSDDIWLDTYTFCKKIKQDHFTPLILWRMPKFLLEVGNILKFLEFSCFDESFWKFE